MKRINCANFSNKNNGSYKMLNINDNDEFKEVEKDFKRGNKKYLAARHETDKHIRVIKSENSRIFLMENLNN